MRPQFNEVTRCSRPQRRALASCGGREQRRSVDCTGGVNYRLRFTPTALDRFSTLQYVQASHGSASQAGRPVTEVRPIACNALTNVLGKSVITAIVHFPPDAFTAAHRHPGSVVAVVISGTLRSQLDGGPIGTYTTHQAWFEPSGALHNFVENASTTEPADLLATFIVDGNCGPLVIPEPRP